MKGHDIESWTNSINGDLDKGIQEYFNDFSANKFGKIMKSAGVDTLNCMKLAHYLQEYQRLFSAFDGQNVNMLEIGVQHGGSYRLWKNYFGEDLLRWTGIDINPRCLALNNSFSPSKALVY